MSAGNFLSTTILITESVLAVHCKVTAQLATADCCVYNCLISFTKAFFISGIPYPTRSSGLLALVADCFITLMMPILFISGKACHKQVVSPAIFGQAKEVPFPNDG